MFTGFFFLNKLNSFIKTIEKTKLKTYKNNVKTRRRTRLETLNISKQNNSKSEETIL